MRPTLGGVSSDHTYTFVHVAPEFGNRIGGILAGELGADYLGRPDGSFELVGVGSEGTEPLVQGRYISPGGKHVIFSTGKANSQSEWCFVEPSCKVLKLEPKAPETGTGAVYDRKADGTAHVVSMLPPNDTPAPGQQAFYQGASKDGTTIAYMIEDTLYVRVNSGEPGEESEQVAAGNPVYGGFSADGHFLFYVAGGNKGTIHRFDTATATDVALNPSAEGEVVNVSEDGSHVYFIAEEAIGGEGAADEPNLFVWNGSALATELVATVAPSDLERTSGTRNSTCPEFCGIPALTRWTNVAVAPMSGVERGPGGDSSRTTPNGKVIVFESKGELTTYENAGHTEVYRWEEGGAGVECVSCRAATGPAQSDAQLQELAEIPVGIAIHNLSADGAHVFFETGEALSPADVDGVNDIYEWSQGSLVPALLSSGHSVEYIPRVPVPQPIAPNLLLSVTPNGSDVFFLTPEVLVPGAGEGGAQAIYDARVNGGFPGPPPPPAPCAEEGCRRATTATAPPFATPLSQTGTSKGNLKPKRKHHRHKKKRRHKKRRVARLSSELSAPAMSVTSDPAAEPSTPQAQQAVGTTAPTASALGGSFESFGIESLSGAFSTSAAAQHPDFTTSFSLTHGTLEGKAYSDARPDEIAVSLPPGLLGNPNAFPRCSTGNFVAYNNCPFESQVGVANAVITGQPGVGTFPIYNVAPPHPKQELARLGFFPVLAPVFIDIKVRTASDYGVTATVHTPPSAAGVLASETILWGNPSDESHDALRLTAYEAAVCPSGTVCEEPDGKREVPRTNLAFMSNPAACQAGILGLEVTSYQLPGKVFNAAAPLPEITNCQGLPFAPSFSAEPTSHRAGAATGLSTKLVLPQHLGANEPATATMHEARVTLPAGMGVNPGAANWIDTCSGAQVGFHQEVDANCPDGSKLGTALIKSPALPEPISGAIYQRAPEPGHQLGLWLTADALGLHVKLPGSLEPDNKTGRLTAVFGDLPQVPVEEIDLNVWGGPRAPLTNPPSCGTFQTTFSFAPHSSDPAASGAASMQIDEGCNQPFDPKLQAGTTKPKAGAYSPVIVDLERADGEQALRGFELKLPDGLLAKIKGVGRCSEAQADTGACPAASRLGEVIASAGPGSDPLWIPQPGKPTPGVYLGGPYEGSPLSVITLVSAQAGPFDLGTLVVRSGLGLDPDSNRPVIKADPLPQFFEGAELTYRKLHVTIDRPHFAINPTDCSQMQVNSTVTSIQGTVAHPKARFQVDGCKRLKFKPRLAITLKGGTDRADYPALTAILKARKGDANIARASVALPHSEFLAQEHIVTICTRKQFAAEKCPKGSVYGFAEARTPLLAKPLKGPVYLRSSSHPLPDMVAALHGELDVNLVGRIDSTKGGGIRTTFDAVPDAPVRKFVLKMRGGRKSLLTNSTNVCLRPHRAQATFTAQNGRAVALRPVLKFKGCGGKKGKR